ncbi:MAG: QueT transporter family protein [Ruminococcaceae bacterium]|nr:QueT transporter family protein [Oscillospiraceae bacterium]
MKHKSILFISQSAIIAALYVVLTMLANALGLASMPVQLRFSEALTILPVFTPAAIPGLFIGCVISNFLSNAIIWDVVFGSLATLIGALGTYFLRRFKVLPLLPPILANTLIVPFVLVYAYGIEGTVPFFMLTVGLGELISCGVLGYFLHRALQKKSKYIKWD